MCVLLFRSVRSSMRAKSIDAYDKALIIGRLDTLKALQVAYRSVNGHYAGDFNTCLLYTSPSPRDVEESRMPSSA